MPIRQATSIFPIVGSSTNTMEHGGYYLKLSGYSTTNRYKCLERLKKELVGIDAIYNESGSSFFSLYFNHKDSDTVINAFNSIVEELRIESVGLKYIENDEHYNCIIDSIKYSIITSSSDAFPGRNFKYTCSFNYKDILRANLDIKEFLLKCGFVENINKTDDIKTKSFITLPPITITKGNIPYACFVYFNNVSDIFPLKCKLENLQIKEIRIYDYHGIIPVEYYKKFD